MRERAELSIDENGIAVATISHAPLNIYDLEMRDSLIEIFEAVRDIPGIRCFVLRGEGKHFGVGADLTEFGNADSISEARRIRWERDPWNLLLSLEVPSIALLHGFAMGSSLEMALLCDIRIAASDTVLGLPETKLGMLPAAGGTQSLTRVIGANKALPLILTARNIDAKEALSLGVVSEVVPPGDLEKHGIYCAQRIALMDLSVTSRLKRCISGAGDLSLAQGLELEKRLASQIR